MNASNLPFDYQGDDWLLVIIKALWQQTSIIHDESGRAAAWIDPAGRRCSSVQELMACLQRMLDALGSCSGAAYEAGLKSTALIGTEVHRYTHVYDACGRLRAAIDPLGSASGSAFNNGAERSRDDKASGPETPEHQPGERKAPDASANDNAPRNGRDEPDEPTIRE